MKYFDYMALVVDLSEKRFFLDWKNDFPTEEVWPSEELVNAAFIPKNVAMKEILIYCHLICAKGHVYFSCKFLYPLRGNMA